MDQKKSLLVKIQPELHAALAAKAKQKTLSMRYLVEDMIARDLNGGVHPQSFAAASFADFLQAWQAPCECCGMLFPLREVALAWAAWSAHCDNGLITPQTLAVVLDGLQRWRASEDWHDAEGRYVPSVAAWLGWGRDFRSGNYRWLDRPRPRS